MATDGTQANGFSRSPSISADGRYVAFVNATNLVPGDTNGSTDIFLHDRQKAATFRVSLGAPFHSGERGNSDWPVLSRDGRFVAFDSHADNLVPGDTNGLGTLQGIDIFVRDRSNQTVRRTSLAQAGAQVNGSSFQPAMTPDGRYVAFHSFASRHRPGRYQRRVRHLRPGSAGEHDQSSKPPHRLLPGGPDSSTPASRRMGRKWRSFLSRSAPGDKDNRADIYLRDRRAQSIRLLSVALPGVPPVSDFSSAPAISADGRSVVFSSLAANLVPWRHERTGGRVRRNTLAKAKPFSAPGRTRPSSS